MDGDTAALTVLVSVIVATNRTSPFLEEAIRSVTEQTHPRVELIVVDDGSADPDSLQRTIALFPQASLVHQAASGVSAARNAGAARAHGQYLAFLDDDDRWHPERLERQLSHLVSAPDAVLGYCGMQSIDELGRVIALADQTAVSGEADVARRNAGIILPNVIIRRDQFEAVHGFRSDLRLAEDLDLVLTLSTRGPFVFTPGALVDYRAHAANTTARYRELARAIAAVIRRHLQEARSRGAVEVAAAHRQSLRANGRFAWWAALRSARRNLRASRVGSAASDILWALGFAPFALPDALLRRVRRSR